MSEYPLQSLNHLDPQKDSPTIKPYTGYQIPIDSPRLRKLPLPIVTQTQKIYPSKSVRKILYFSRENGTPLNIITLSIVADQIIAETKYQYAEKALQLVGYKLVAKKDMANFTYRKQKKIKLAGKAYAVVPLS